MKQSLDVSTATPLRQMKKYDITDFLSTDGLDPATEMEPRLGAKSLKRGTLGNRELGTRAIQEISRGINAEMTERALIQNRFKGPRAKVKTPRLVSDLLFPPFLSTSSHLYIQHPSSFYLLCPAVSNHSDLPSMLSSHTTCLSCLQTAVMQLHVTSPNFHSHLIPKLARF